MTVTTTGGGPRGTAVSARPAPRRGAGALGVLGRVWLAALALAGWEIGTRQAESVFFPPPSAIAARMYEQWLTGPAGRVFLTDEALETFGPSLARMLGGWLIASVAGVALGLAIGRSRALADYVDPLIEFGRAVPPSALVPLFMVLFAEVTDMQLATVVFGVIWPILINTIDGARYLDRLHTDIAQVFRLSRAQRLFRLMLPAAAPKIVAGLRLGLSLSIILMVVSELVGSTNGFGYELLDSQSLMDMTRLWGIIVVLGILGYVLNTTFLAVERRVLSWHRQAQQTT
ncbi:nitrate ABC transporter permease [Sphaerisporangium rufum]|uniref:Nitrate ABC transporter permease n=1 Tax=Sphaerisporangium rufum TaxID=1381558 RepID=A0A919V7N0_9ACTN|nr:ABC transporter permease [Sphaerisporangium rufum]GII80550.1 nitrate ABC transporter permease [Sphaerisporangium rufum]